MPKRLEYTKIQCLYFVWVLSLRHGMYYADGRSNILKLKRQSLGTRDLEEAKRRLQCLDQQMAVKHKLADRSVLIESDNVPQMTFDEAWKAYEQHISRPVEIGGVADSSRKRYFSTFSNFHKFVSTTGVKYWNHVNKRLLEQYVKHRNDSGRAYSTIVNDVTNIKTLMNWLIEEDYVPQSCKIKCQPAPKVGQ